jgi:DNA-binding response OmpR family regulator
MSAAVLLVDDDRAALYALREVLSDLPVEAVLAGSGEEALRYVLRQPFAAILLDVRLPKMDGFEVAAAIRSVGAEDYLRKPLAPEVVRARIAALVPPVPGPATIGSGK